MTEQFILDWFTESNLAFVFVYSIILLILAYGLYKYDKMLEENLD